MSGGATERRLRQLLGRYTTTWDGRGNLRVQDYRWLTRVLLGLMLFLIGGSASILLGVASGAAIKLGLRTPEFVGSAYYGIAFAFLFLAAWWTGPVSRAGVPELREILDLQPGEAETPRRR